MMASPLRRTSSDPSGKYLYATNRGHESICVFRVSEKDGNLTYQEHVSSEGKFPWSLDISDHGELVLVANQHSNNVVIFFEPWFAFSLK